MYRRAPNEILHRQCHAAHPLRRSRIVQEPAMSFSSSNPLPHQDRVFLLGDHGQHEVFVDFIQLPERHLN